MYLYDLFSSVLENVELDLACFSFHMFVAVVVLQWLQFSLIVLKENVAQFFVN